MIDSLSEGTRSMDGNKKKKLEQMNELAHAELDVGGRMKSRIIRWKTNVGSRFSGKSLCAT